MEIEIPKHLVRALWREIRLRYPAEAVALLFGTNVEEYAVIREVLPIANAIKGVHGFGIPRNAYASACNKRPGQLIGFFHSHLEDATPSSADIKTMQSDASMIWLIGRSGNPPNGRDFQLRAFCLGAVPSKDDPDEIAVKEVHS